MKGRIILAALLLASAPARAAFHGTVSAVSVATSPSQTLTDGGGNTWALTGCKVHKNGIVVSASPNANVLRIALKSGTIYYYGNGASWYQWTGSAWSGASDPGTYDQIITGPGRPGPQISDPSGNIWTIEDCVPAENGVSSWPQSVLLMAVHGTIHTEYNNGSWNDWDPVGAAWQGETASPIGQLGFGLTATAGQAI